MNPTQENGLPSMLGVPDINAAKDYGKAFAEMYIEEVQTVLKAFTNVDASILQTVIGLYIQLRFR